MLSFIGLIVVGALLLMMPFAHTPQKDISFLEALFYSYFGGYRYGSFGDRYRSDLYYYGKLILLVLIQFGGLGVLTISSVLVLLIAKRIGFLY